MKLFFLDRSDRPNNQIWGYRKWTISYAMCRKCGYARTAGHDYPVVDLESLNPPLPGHPLTWPDFLKLAERIRPFVPSYLPVLDGLGLGPLFGPVKGRLGDLISTVGPGVDCLRAEKFDELLTRGVPGLIGVPAQVKSKQEPNIRVTELQVQGLLRLGSKNYPDGKVAYCPECGRITNLLRLLPEDITIKRSSIPHAGDVFGMMDWGSGILVSERFKEAASGLLNNAKFNAIPVLDE